MTNESEFNQPINGSMFNLAKIMIELPYKVGDFIVWRNGEICGGYVTQVSINADVNGVEGVIFAQCDNYIEEFDADDFNQSWFLSVEELLRTEANNRIGAGR